MWLRQTLREQRVWYSWYDNTKHCPSPAEVTVMQNICTNTDYIYRERIIPAIVKILSSTLHR